MQKKPDGDHIEHRTVTGRVQTEEIVRKSDGAQQVRHFAPGGKVTQEVVVNHDRSKLTTNFHYDRNGQEHAKEVIKRDERGVAVSRTVSVRQTTIIKNTTIVNNTVIVKNYDRGRYGFVYRPVYVARSPVFVSWYQPYRPFHYAWGWEGYGWYRYHPHYWVTYDVYPAPSYWVTDYVIASYAADRYTTAVSLAQVQEDVRIAREDAEKAKLAAENAAERAEIAEARAAQHDAEARLAQAELKAAKVEAEETRAKSQAGSVNSNATPIDSATKELLRSQIERTVAEQKAMAEQSEKGSAAVPGLAKALADSKRIYPVSSSVSVTLPDGNPAGTLTEGDLLRLEPGQEDTLKDAGENTLVSMRVLSSKGEDGEVKAGTVITLPLKSLQDFDSEFRAKLDLGLAEADKNKDQFKSGALKDG